ncbi:bifunctional phosphoribosylaminoimidazole carboxylase/phosphoribosylaminoimidazole succinocarboxamide synthetase isoform X2 [Salminus brasiliensis]|uniref:bifunctional phosphoribosylaminoimidazole carboxylase/phosphoribosylaminoimidazole succinocarboxamide synthetase isoform X2 n=1 Tax=Salminus brasiliensis TaxID=930266 RepID=UPI003B835234
MEPSAEEKRSGSREEERQQQRGTAAHWNGSEVKALLVVWREREAWDEPEGRAKYEAISSRLRDFGIMRDWVSCQTQSRAMALPDWRPPPPRAQQGYSSAGQAPADNRTAQRPYEAGDEHGSPANRREGAASLSTFQEGMEGGRHWSDKEIRALLTVWADREVQGRLQTTHRNKAIFQEMARRLEVDAILQGKVNDDGLDEDDDLPREEPERDQGSGRLGHGEDHYIKIDDDESLADMQTIINTGSHPLITKDTGPSTSPMSRMASEDANVITVHDSGRNWTEEEVAALLNIWSEEGIQQQLQVSTRNKDVFVQISRRLLQQGVERDWKQCRTKYKNLKYLYRSLQRGKADIGDTRRIMKFYEQLDNILSRPNSGLYRTSGMFSPPMFDEHSFGETPSHEDCDVIAVEYDQQDMDDAILRGSPGITTRLVQNQATTDSGLKRSVENPDAEYGKGTRVDDMLLRSNGSTQAGYGERPLCSHSVTAGPYDGGQEYKINKDDSETTFMEREHAVSSRRRKRKATDEDFSLTCKRFHQSMDDGDSSTDWSENIDYQCKEEQDQYIPIMEITSVCSMASNTPASENLGLRVSAEMASSADLKLGKKLNEGKTKQIFELLDEPGHVLVQSKDQITAGNAVRKDQMEGKAAIANKTTSCVFKLLQDAGVKTAFVRQHSDTAFVASRCEMIPIEWVCRRVATGSFLKRNPGVKEGYRFSPLKLEMFFKDDANNDPQWSEEQLLAANFDLAGMSIGRCEVDIMSKSTVAIFEILEKAWATQNCTLVDMKIEFGVNVTTKEVVLADVIDNDSWRLWPAGDRSQQKDKQVYRDLKEVTPEAMQMVKRNFEWVSERVKLLLEPESSGRVVVLMGSTSDMAHCERIRKACSSYGIPCHLRVTSAHKGPDETLRIKAEYEGDGVPTIFVAVAGRSNGLGPVMSGNTAYPVINCPPVTPDWGAQDVWSSLRMPSGLGCSTVLSPDAAAQHAAQILGLTDHLIWAKLRASMLNTWISLKQADKKLQQCSL